MRCIICGCLFSMDCPSGDEKKASIAFNPGPEWAIDKQWGRPRLRICFANPTEEVLRKGVAALAQVCHKEMGVPERIANVTLG